MVLGCAGGLPYIQEKLFLGITKCQNLYSTEPKQLIEENMFYQKSWQFCQLTTATRSIQPTNSTSWAEEAREQNIQPAEKRMNSTSTLIFECWQEQA